MKLIEEWDNLIVDFEWATPLEASNQLQKWSKENLWIDEEIEETEILLNKLKE